MSEQEMFEILREFDTPSITNVVATYPGTETCLSLYNPWTENWYTDTSIRCMYPELGPLVGYAVTCVYGLPDPNYSELSFLDVIDALDASEKPTILVFEAEVSSRDNQQSWACGREYDFSHEGGRLCRRHIERSFARHR